MSDPTAPPPRTMTAANLVTKATMTFTADHMPPKIAQRVMILGAGMAMGAFLGGGNLVAAAQSIVRGVSPEAFETIRDALAGSCTVALGPGAPSLPLTDVYDTAFHGNHSAFVQWFVFAIRWNFESFFDDLSSGALAARIPGKPPGSPTPSPKA